MNQLWDRRQFRVDYKAAVRVVMPEDRRTIFGHSANLSESGIFVAATESCPVGARVICEIALPEERLTLEGRVVWLQRANASSEVGMGIQFVELSLLDISALRRLVEQQSGAVRQVTAWFEGLNEPLRAEAQFTSGGVELRAPMPFLRSQGAVDLSFGATPGEPHGGRLRRITLESDSAIPRLRIEVALPHSVEARQAAVAGVLGREEDTDDGPEIHVCEPATEQPISGQSEAQSGELCHGAAIADVEIPAGKQRGKPGRDELWTMGNGNVDETNDYSRFWREEQTSRRRKWLWLAATVMAAIAVASVVQTRMWTRWSGTTPAGGDPSAGLAALEPDDGFESRKDEAIQSPPAQPLAGEDQKPGPRRYADPTQPTPEATASGPSMLEKTLDSPPKTGAMVREKAQQPKPIAKKQAQASNSRPTIASGKRDDKKNVARAKAPASGSRPRVSVVDDGALTVSIPVRGSAVGLDHYPLAKPDGIAINLPEATSEIPLGLYHHRKDGLKSVWIRQRDDGITQIRVFFDRDQHSGEVSVAERRLRIKLTPIAQATASVAPLDPSY